MPTTPPRARQVQYTARLGTRWEKEKAAAGKGAFDFPEDPTTVGPWLIGECVGKGASGRVKVARHSTTGQMAAVKILPLEAVISSRASLRTKENKAEKHRNGIDKEIIMMKLMDHPNIVRIFDVYEGENELFLILEYVDGGELFDYLVNHGKLDASEGLCYFKQIIYGLNYAHAFSIIHRDLKPENILIHSFNPPRIKIADWGMAAFAPPSYRLETSCGSPHYASPEIVNGKRYEGTATDIWSCGVILFALMTGRLPFDDKNIKILLHKVKSGKFEIPTYVNGEAADLIRRMLIVDVDKRITMPDILSHPFLQHATPGITYVPAPSLSELARPHRSAAHLKPDLIRSLHVICRPVGNDEDLTVALLSPPGEGSLVKALYFLLVKHRERSLEDYGMSDAIKQNESNIRHYPAPPPRTRPKSKTISHGTGGAPIVTDVHPSQKASHGRSPQTPPVSSIAEPSSPGKHGVRSRPTSPLGPRPPHSSASHAAASKQQIRPISTPSHCFTDIPLKLPAPRDAILVGAPIKPPRPAHPRRGRTIDGLPFPSRFNGREDNNGSNMSSPMSPHQSFNPVPVATFIRAPGASSPQRAQGDVGASADMVLWPQIQPPIVDDPELQRTIDEVAGRFNALALKDHRVNVRPNVHVGDHAQVGGNLNGGRLAPARGINVNAVGEHGPALTDAQAYVQAHAEERGHGPGALYCHANDATVSLVENEPDKENRDRRSTVTHGSLEPKVGAMQKEISFSAIRAKTKEEKKVHRRSRPAPLDLHNTKRSTISGMGVGSPLMSPPLAPASSALMSPAVGEFKGWFSNLFNWKAQQYALHSVDNCLTTRDEVMRLLEQFGVSVLLEDAQGWGVLRCRAEEGYDIMTGSVINKPVRFRVEFSPVLGYLQPTTPRLSHIPVSEDIMSPRAKSMAPFASTLLLVQEKGALSTFKQIYSRLRAEWRLDALRSPDVGGGTPMFAPTSRMSR